MYCICIDAFIEAMNRNSLRTIAARVIDIKISLSSMHFISIVNMLSLIHI